MHKYKEDINMKKYEIYESSNNCAYTLVVGTDRQIRSLYKKLAEHDFLPSFCDAPKFRKGGMYGIIIEEDGRFFVINSDTVVNILVTTVI